MGIFLPTRFHQDKMYGLMGTGGAGEVGPLGYVAAVIASAPIAYWPMDDGSGTNVDEVIANRDATLSGGSWDAGCLVNNPSSLNSIDFSPDGLVQIPNESIFDNLFGAGIVGGSECTIEFIFSGPSQLKAVIDKLGSGGWRIGSNNAYSWAFVYQTSGITYTNQSTTVYGTPPLGNTCFHVAFRWNSALRNNTSYISWVVNGVSDATTSISIGSGNLIPDTSATQMRVGNNQAGTRKFLGNLSHLAIYDRLVSTSELCEHFQESGITAPPTAPTGCP